MQEIPDTSYGSALGDDYRDDYRDILALAKTIREEEQKQKQKSNEQLLDRRRFDKEGKQIIQYLMETISNEASAEQENASYALLILARHYGSLMVSNTLIQKLLEFIASDATPNARFHATGALNNLLLRPGRILRPARIDPTQWTAIRDQLFRLINKREEHIDLHMLEASVLVSLKRMDKNM